MRNAIFLVAVVVCVAALGFFFLRQETSLTSSLTSIMKVDSSLFHDGDTLPRNFTCDGAGVRPPLTFSGLPDGTQTLAVAVEDPDAVGGVFTHWVAWNFTSDVASIRGDELAAGAVEGRNSAGETGWYAACPPNGTGPHQYIFTIYALDVSLTLPTDSTFDAFLQAADGHILARGSVTGLYER